METTYVYVTLPLATVVYALGDTEQCRGNRRYHQRIKSLSEYVHPNAHSAANPIVERDSRGFAVDVVWDDDGNAIHNSEMFCAVLAAERALAKK